PRAVEGRALPLDAQHPRLVRLAPALVGPPDPRLVLRVRPRYGVAADAPGLRDLPLGPPDAGSRRARHLVLLGAVAVLHPRLARAHQGAAHVLSELGAGDRVRHPLLLGGPDGHAGPALHGG